MRVLLGITIALAGCAMIACSGEVSPSDQGSTVQGQAGAGGSPASGGGGSNEGTAGTTQGSSGSRAMGSSGTNSTGAAGAGGSMSTADAGPTGGQRREGDRRRSPILRRREQPLPGHGDGSTAHPVEHARAFAATGAQVDYAARTAHTHFSTSKGVPGVEGIGRERDPRVSVAGISRSIRRCTMSSPRVCSTCGTKVGRWPLREHQEHQVHADRLRSLRRSQRRRDRYHGLHELR